MYIYMYTHTHTYIYINTHIHIYTHTCIHICRHRLTRSSVSRSACLSKPCSRTIKQKADFADPTCSGCACGRA